MKPSPSSGGGTLLTATSSPSPSTRTTRSGNKMIASPGRVTRSSKAAVASSVSDSRGAMTTTTTMSTPSSSVQAMTTTTTTTTAENNTMAIMPPPSSSSFPSSEVKISELTLDSTEKKLSLDSQQQQQQEEATTIKNAADSNSNDIMMKDAALPVAENTTTTTTMIDAGNTNNAAKVKIEEGQDINNSGNQAMEVDLEVDPLPNEAEGGGDSAASTAAATTTAASAPPLSEGANPPVVKMEGEDTNDTAVGGEQIIIPGIVINNNNNTKVESSNSSESVMAATANKLTGVSAAPALPAATAVAVAVAAASAPVAMAAAASINGAPAKINDEVQQAAPSHTATATSMTATTTAANNNNSNSSNSPSFSMTLAIGPEDTQRVFHASRAFNAEIQKLKKRYNGDDNNDVDVDAIMMTDSKVGKKGVTSSSGNGIAATTTEQTKRKSMDDNEADRKKKPAIVHSPHTREEALKPPLKPSGTPNNVRKEATISTTAATTTTSSATSSSSSSSSSSSKTPSSKPRSSSETILHQPLRGPQPLRNLLIPAAKSTQDPLIASFLSQMDSREEILAQKQTSLLFFLDADKSTKLLAAFDVLSHCEEERRGKALSIEEGQKKMSGNGEEDSASKLVGRTGLIRLFQSFLTSISTCVHGGNGDQAKGGGFGNSRATTPTAHNKSPPEADGKKGNVVGDWKGSDRTQKEILEVATFAADNLMEFARKEQCSGGDSAANQQQQQQSKEGETVGVSFDIFGKWYNSGGFSLVPWLELLDLSKWDYSNTTTATTASSAPSASSSASVQSSSSKRARIHQNNDTNNHNNECMMTPGVSNMNEPIGSPTELFASGAMLGATPQPPAKAKHAESSAFERGGGGGSVDGVQSFSAMFGEMDESRTVVSFDFSGSTPNNSNASGGGEGSSFHIDITEENLVMLRNLVRRTGFASLTPQHVESLMMKHARVERHKYGETIYVISRTQFGKFIREVVPKESSKHFDPTEIENFSNYFTNFFTCFDYSWSDLKKDEVNAKELMVGFSFLFSGNKSSKLAAAYEMLDVERTGYLTQRGLMQYLRSYLTMLAGISLLSANKKTTTQIRKRLMSTRRDDAFLAVENGAKWTLSHFLRTFEQELQSQQRNSTRSNAVTFEDFAKWYTEGGYAVAPWLELLDLQKFLSLIGGNESSGGGKYPADSNDLSLGEVLFTFPLANSRSLVVLRDDAHYVRSVVNELGLLSLTSEDIWSVLFADVAKSLARASTKSNVKKSIRMEVDPKTFVDCMMRILSGTGKIKQHSSASDLNPEETLRNFYLSFDLAETKRVPLNQLMCGLTLLCGGKKSNKLVFAFGLFGGDDSGKNGKKKASMTHNDFFFFFRSFLIVMFSCCNQSLSLSADAVTQYITNTAKSVADDVMGYWKAKKVDKVKFENFSEWYNEGGFETAPWLELLDLNKWVLADQSPQQQQQQQEQPQPQPQPQEQSQQQPQEPPVQQQQQQQQAVPPTPAPAKYSAMPDGFGLTPGHEAIKALLATPKVRPNSSPSNPDCPPAPDDDPLFDLDISAVDGEVDEMDFMLQNDSVATQGHVENVNYVDPAAATAAQTPGRPAEAAEPQNALKFNLLTHDQFGGYMISIGPDQVQLLHRIVTETGLYQIDAPTICRFILYDTKSRRINNLTKKGFRSAMNRVFNHTYKSLPAPVSESTQEELSAFTQRLFNAFDRTPKAGKINAIELACAFTVLCGGRKSDKLEHVFELLDQDKDTLVSRQDISRFIKSFLVMLMSVSSSFTHLYGEKCNNDASAVSRAIEAGSEWATAQVFDALQPKNGLICFDDFAEWYTKGGYQSMPWLELLDLRKWVLGDS